MSWAKISSGPDNTKIWIELPGVAKFKISLEEARELALALITTLRDLPRQNTSDNIFIKAQARLDSPIVDFTKDAS